jgi:hypothetical protein
MALTDTQKLQFRLFLGYANVYRQYNTYLEGVFDLIESDPALETMVIAQLAVISSIDVFLLDSIENAGLKRVEDIEFYPDGQQLKYQNQEGRKMVGRLSIMSGVDIYSDYFGTQGFLGVNNSYRVNGYIQLG